MKKTNPLKIVEIENYANNLRKELGIPSNSFFPVLEVMEKFHVDGLLTIQYLEDDDSLFEDDTPAKYNPADNFIYVKESVLEELEKHEYRANFTLAHELFHYFQCQVLGFEFEEVENCPSFEDPEWQADEFAAQLLLQQNMWLEIVILNWLLKCLTYQSHALLLGNYIMKED